MLAIVIAPTVWMAPFPGYQLDTRLGRRSRVLGSGLGPMDLRAGNDEVLRRGGRVI